MSIAQPGDSPRLTPATGQLETQGQQAGRTVWKNVPVEAPLSLEWIAERAGPSVAFRGHWAEKDVNLAETLATGLERVCLRIDAGSLTRALLREKSIVRQFRRRVHHYLPSMSLPAQSLELVALMQHHGAPTRLLDWTYSLYVAAHFALKHASSRPRADLAIWTIRPDWCRDASKAACGGMTNPPFALWESIEGPEDDRMAGINLLSGELPPSIWPVSPFKLNERLTIQQGVFLAPGDVTQSFLWNLAVLPSSTEAELTRYTIPRSHSPEIARTLYRMNVTETTLFPGLDGFARSLWFFPEILSQGG